MFGSSSTLHHPVHGKCTCSVTQTDEGEARVEIQTHLGTPKQTLQILNLPKALIPTFVARITRLDEANNSLRGQEAMKNIAGYND